MLPADLSGSWGQDKNDLVLCWHWGIAIFQPGRGQHQSILEASKNVYCALAFFAVGQLGEFYIFAFKANI